MRSYSPQKYRFHERYQFSRVPLYLLHFFFTFYLHRCVIEKIAYPIYTLQSISRHIFTLALASMCGTRCIIMRIRDPLSRAPTSPLLRIHDNGRAPVYTAAVLAGRRYSIISELYQAKNSVHVRMDGEPSIWLYCNGNILRLAYVLEMCMGSEFLNSTQPNACYGTIDLRKNAI